MLPYDYSVSISLRRRRFVVVDIAILFGPLPSPSLVLRESAIVSNCLELPVVCWGGETLGSGI